MNNILLLDTSVASLNKGDDIIMECTRKELSPILEHSFEISLPTHVSPFHWYQVLRNSLYVRQISNCTYKFVGGTNILVPNLLTHFPQWNINMFNYQPMKGCILVGVGVGSGAEGRLSKYTKYVYQHLLSRDRYHSVRDERSKSYAERLGLKAINTGCVTMWMLTPDFCESIPTKKADQVVFTITPSSFPNRRKQVQHILDTLNRIYHKVYFWPQGIDDINYFKQLEDINNVTILPATKQAYDDFLTNNEVDYVGTRLHGGVYAMRHKRRSVIISVDERARSIDMNNHLNCIDIENLNELESILSSSIETKVKMDFEMIYKWKKQFEL